MGLGWSTRSDKKGTMICIICALYPEARPIVKALGLKEQKGWGKSRVFEGEELLLAVSGPGALNASILTTKICERFSKEIELFLNLGICGLIPGNKKGISLGEQVLVTTLTHEHEKEVYHPEVLFEHRLKEVSLLTVSAPLSSDGIKRSELMGRQPIDIVDMEAYGFFRAAQGYLPPSRLHIIKVPSDELEPLKVDSAMVSTLIDEVLEDILVFIEHIKGVLSKGSENALHGNLLNGEFEALLNCGLLTDTMHHQLLEAIAYGRNNKMAHSSLRRHLKEFWRVKERRKAKTILRELRRGLQEVPLELK